MVWQTIVGVILLIIGFTFWSANPLVPFIALIASIVFISIGAKKSRKVNKPEHPSNIPPIDTDLNTRRDTYVVNPKTMVLHRSSCPYAQKTFSSNKSHTGSRNGAISIGYKPCKYCKP